MGIFSEGNALNNVGLLTDDGFEILTQTSSGTIPAEFFAGR